MSPGAVLSDNGKRSLYDIGLYDPFEEEEEVIGSSCRPSTVSDSRCISSLSWMICSGFIF